MAKVMEFVQFKLKEGASVTDFLTASDKFQKDYLTKCKGYITRTLALKDDMWVDCVIWETMDNAQKAMEEAYESPLFTDFGSFLDIENCEAQHLVVQRTY